MIRASTPSLRIDACANAAAMRGAATSEKPRAA
jgi:hypothetical protein